METSLSDSLLKNRIVHDIANSVTHYRFIISDISNTLFDKLITLVIVEMLT